MQGKEIVKKEIMFLSVMFFVVFGFGMFFILRVYVMSDWHRGLSNNEVIFLGLLLVSFVYILNKIINKMSECYSDYLDYSDIEDIKINSENKNNEIHDKFNSEIWNNINRRAEKAKIVALSSLQFREIKSSIEDFLKKNSK